MSRRPHAAVPATPAPVRKIRCAVYTRKSTDEGLEKEFNSLDAQRESCEAYIASQRAEALAQEANGVGRGRGFEMSQGY